VEERGPGDRMAEKAPDGRGRTGFVIQGIPDLLIRAKEP